MGPIGASAFPTPLWTAPSAAHRLHRPSPLSIPFYGFSGLREDNLRVARRRHLDQRAIISRERPQRRPYPALFDLSIPCLTCFGSQARFRLISGSERTRRRRLPPVGDGVAQAALSSAHAGGGRPPGPLCGPGWSRARGTFGPDSAGRDHRQVVPRVTPSQHRQLTRWAECARLTYNWALSEWDRQYADHRAGSQPGRTRRSRSRSRRAALSRICSGYSGRRDGCRTGRRSPPRAPATGSCRMSSAPGGTSSPGDRRGRGRSAAATGRRST